MNFFIATLNHHRGSVRSTYSETLSSIASEWPYILICKT